MPPGDLSTLEFCRVQSAPPTSSSCQGSSGHCPSLTPPSTCLAKGLCSAEASFLCTRHKQLFLLSLLLMLAGELADHFLLTGNTPPRNDRLPPSVLLIIKRHFSLLPHHSYSQNSVGALPCQGQQGRLDHWIPKEPREGTHPPQWKLDTRLPPRCTGLLFLSYESLFACSSSQCPANFIWVNNFRYRCRSLKDWPSASLFSLPSEVVIIPVS